MAVMAAFTKEYQVRVNYIGLSTEESFIEAIRKQQCDVAVIANQYMQKLIAEEQLAEINYHNIPNFKNIAANFRDPAYDPGNQHSIPFRWGATGLLVHIDKLGKPVKRWADLAEVGTVALWDMPRGVLAIALKATGHSVNSEAPEALEAALDFLRKLKPNLMLWPPTEPSIVPSLIQGQAVMAFGWSFDALIARTLDANMAYVLPEDGTILWGENLIVTVNSPHKATAESVINFLLRPEMSAQNSNVLHFATANEAARAWIDQQWVNDPVIFPQNQYLVSSELIQQLSPQGEKLYAQTWERFIASLK
jgi:spermidine/putrescine transport system substrate-binding protein